MIYRIAGNIGGELNLTDWWIWKQTAKLKSANIWFFINCVVHVCKDRLKIYQAMLLERSRPSVCPSKVTSLTDEELQCANKEVESVLKQKASGAGKHHGKYNDYMPQDRWSRWLCNHQIKNCQYQFCFIFCKTAKNSRQCFQLYGIVNVCMYVPRIRKFLCEKFLLH